MEENLEVILEKINTSVEERVNAAIKTGITCIAQQYRQVDQANTTATTDLKAQVADLKSTVAQLRSQLGARSYDINAGDGDSSKTDTVDGIDTVFLSTKTRYSKTAEGT